MSNKRQVSGAEVRVALLTVFCFVLLGLAISGARAQAEKPVVFTHAVFAELGTATW